MAGFTSRRCLDMRCRLTPRIHTIVTGGAVTTNIGVIKLTDRPSLSGMAGITLLSRLNMVSRLAR